MHYPIDAESQIYQNIQLLTIHDEFLQDVSQIRKKYDIDWIKGDEEQKAEKRFFGETNEEFDSYFDNHLNDCDYMEFDDYNTETKEIIYYESEKYKKFKKTVSELLEKYNLPKEYHESIDIYIQQGFIPDTMFLKRSDLDRTFFDEEKGYVSIRVYPSTTKKDYNLCWEVAQLNLAKMKKNGPKKRIDNFSRNIKMVKMQKEDMTSEQIAKQINEKYKLKGNKKLMYDNVNIIIHRMKKQLEKLITH